MAVRRNVPPISTDTASVLTALGTLPALHYTPPHLFVTVGLPGVGKSTFARRLAPLVHAVIIESDAMRRRLFGIPVHSSVESRHLFRAINAAAVALLLQGTNVIVDATNLSEHDRRPYYAMASEAGARLHMLHLVAPEGIVKERLAHRLATGGDILAADEDVYSMLARNQQPISVANLRIDTSSPAAIDAALVELQNACRPLESAGAGGIA
jgi:predicted kinase